MNKSVIRSNLHIMHVIDSLGVGGAERIVVEMANQTVADGWPVSICITRSDRALAKGLKPGIPLWVLDRHRRWDWGAMKKFASLVKEQKVDLLHVHGRSTLSFLSVVRLFKLIHVPVIFLDHHGRIEIDTSIPAWFKLLGQHSFDQYVGVSAKLGDWARTVGISPDKIMVIENGLDLQSISLVKPIDLRKSFGIGPDTYIGITVGGWRWEKGLDVLIEAVARSSFPKSGKILIVGGARDQGYVQKCLSLIDSYGLGNNFLLLGERSDVIGLLKGADFAVMPSRSESGPLSLIEYLACALPVVSTKVGAIARRASELGLLDFVCPDNPDALAQALDRLLSLSPEERLARGREGLAICQEHFDIRGKMPQWYRIYKKIGNKKNDL